MKKAKIRYGLWSMVVVMLFSLSSCLNDVNEETSPNCAILSFSVGNITSYVTVKKYDTQGATKDTVVARTIAGSNIYFNINQLEGHIYSVDSLPVWTNLKRVVPTIVSNGNIYVKSDEVEDLYYSVSSGVDSLDFSKTVELLCVSTDGTARRTYTVDIYQHQENTDTLEWKKGDANVAMTGLSRVLYADDKVFAFTQTGGETMVAVADKKDFATWSVPVGIPVKAESVVLFQNRFYALGADSYIYSADPSQLATTWTRVSGGVVERLLAADACYLYAYDGAAIVGTTADFDSWAPMGTANLDMLPETEIYSVSHALRTNANLQQTVMAGMSSRNETYGVVWYKVASADEKTDQAWEYIQVTDDNPYGLPHAENFSMTYYNGAIYAIAAVDGQYEYLYCSNDNGITWHPLTEKYLMPEDITPADGVARLVAVDDELWIVQENGKVWKGSIQ